MKPEGLGEIGEPEGAGDREAVCARGSMQAGRRGRRRVLCLSVWQWPRLVSLAEGCLSPIRWRRCSRAVLPPVILPADAATGCCSRAWGSNSSSGGCSAACRAQRYRQIRASCAFWPALLRPYAGQVEHDGLRALSDERPALDAHRPAGEALEFVAAGLTPPEKRARISACEICSMCQCAFSPPGSANAPRWRGWRRAGRRSGCWMSP